MGRGRGEGGERLFFFCCCCYCYERKRKEERGKFYPNSVRKLNFGSGSLIISHSRGGNTIPFLNLVVVFVGFEGVFGDSVGLVD